MGRKKESGGLGKSIIKDRFKGHSRPNNDSFLHTTDMDDGYDWGRLNLQSVTEQSNLEDFLSTAELAGTEFTAEKMNVSFVTADPPTGLSEEQTKTIQAMQEKHRKLLRIPRRPAWDETTTAEELQLNERKSFLEWRRGLAELQEIEHLILTPFEKNLEFWRQLWRVIERSDLVVQIVDGRNPLLFRCEDLETYVKEVNPEKVNVILINKADLLSPKQRSIWAKHFDSVGVKVLFWSATAETERIIKEGEAAAAQAELESQLQGGATYYESDEVYDDDDEEDKDEKEDEVETTDGTCKNTVVTNSLKVQSLDISHQSDVQNAEISRAAQAETQNEQNLDRNAESETVDATEKYDCDEKEKAEQACSSCQVKNNPKLLTGDELVEEFKSLHSGQKVQSGITTVGLVGYPNVGKSSTINAILQTKKVPVSATPGRTKHFQTLFVESNLLLCDCPGLVLPTFVSTKAEMVVSGILPIDQLRDHAPPVSLVCWHIPRSVLEATYGIMLPKPQEGEDPDRSPTSYELLTAYGYMRGFMTHKGLPDQPRSARLILKDYMNGKLLYCHPPPGVDVKLFKPAAGASKVHKPTIPQGHHSYKTARESEPSKSSEVDQQFFSKIGLSMGTKGVRKPECYQATNRTTLEMGSVYGSQQSSGKPWKRHNNKNKKEKLRRVHNDLDVHY